MGCMSAAGRTILYELCPSRSTISCRAEDCAPNGQAVTAPEVSSVMSDRG